MAEGKSGFSRQQIWFGRCVVLIGLVVFPFVVPNVYVIHVMALALIASIAALALQLLLGYAGQLSMGQAAFFGIGAYASGLLTKSLGVPFVLAFFAAGAIAAFCSLALAPITRLRGIYLSVATLGFTIIVHLALLNEEWLTGGPFGVLGISWPSIGPIAINTELRMYFLCLVVLILIYVAFLRLVDSRFGRALQAIMLDEDAAQASGINVALYKSKCFVIAAFVTGIAGSLFAHHSRYLNPDDFTFWRSIEILIMTAVGGIGSLPGAVLGAFIVVLLPEYLRFLQEWRLIIYGAVLIILMGLGTGGLSALFSLGFRSVLDASAPLRARLSKVSASR